MDFLLECIGFSPGTDLGELERLLQAEGEPVAWRGPSGTHLRYGFSGGLEVRLDREEDQSTPSLLPHFEVAHRLRVQVQSITEPPDSPFDVLLTGLANPPLPIVSRGDVLGAGEHEDYPLATYLTDARRIPRTLPVGHVLAVSIAGFSLDVSYVGPNAGVSDPYILEEPHGARLLPLGVEDGAPGGCMELSLRVHSVRHLENPLTGEVVEVIEADAPGRPLELFVSRWQLEEQGLPHPRPGWRVEGAFLFTGRVSGGLPRTVRPRR